MAMSLLISTSFQNSLTQFFLEEFKVETETYANTSNLTFSTPPLNSHTENMYENEAIAI